MKFNIAYPATGAQKVIEVDEERKLRHFLDKQLAAEVDGEALGEQFKGYIFKIKGGFDKQGFSMKQGVLVPGRVRLLMGKNTSCYKPRRDGERKRKSVRGCIVSSEIAVLNLVIVKKGDEELPGLTDKIVPRRLGPKRASKIRKLFNLSKEDDVRKYVIRRELPPKGSKGAAAEGAAEGEGDTAKTAPAPAKGGKAGKKRTKAPKIQRLVTPLTLQRKRHRIALKRRRAEKNKADAAAYAKLLAQRAKEKRQSLMSSKRKSQLSQKSVSQKKDSVKADPAATGAAKPAAGAAAAKGAAPAKAAAKAKPTAADGKAAAKPASTKAAAPKAKPASDSKASKPAAPKEPTAAKQKSAPKQQSPKNPKSKPASTPKK